MCYIILLCPPQNDKLLSEHESLELWWVTDADAGLYTLTVNTGNTSLHEEFVVTVLTATAGLKTGERLQFVAAVLLLCVILNFIISPGLD